jgi:protein phosphatase
MKVRPGIELGSRTDVGCVRENNEDSYRYWEPEDNGAFSQLGRLVIVADGMGGTEGGQIASRIAVETLEKEYARSPEADPQRRLLEAFRQAHFAVRDAAHEKPVLLGMGTTLTAFVLLKESVYFAHVGDSRLYLLRAGKLKALTRDHSLVARLVESGVIRSEQAENHPQKHVLTAAVGVSDDLEPDFSPEALTVEPQDTLMVCSDGLWGQVSQDEISEALAKSPQEACDRLVALAREHGGPDNITLQVVRVE